MRQTIPDVLTVVRIKELFFAEASRGAWACRRFGTKRAFAGQMVFGRLLVCSVGILRREAVARVNGFDPDIQLMENAYFVRTCGAEIIDERVLYYTICFLALAKARSRFGARTATGAAGWPASDAGEKRREYGRWSSTGSRPSRAAFDIPGC
jgi:hypothetical protein